MTTTLRLAAAFTLAATGAGGVVITDTDAAQDDDYGYTVQASNISMMPEELQLGMTEQELRDLLGFLKGE